jgi:cbb3-type cytochrome oxidase maturation protein
MSAVDIALLASTIGSIVLFGGAAVLALGWAFKNGQFENFDRGAKSIFGPDEPVGQPTDAFPGVSAAERGGVGPQDAIDRAPEGARGEPADAN